MKDLFNKLRSGVPWDTLVDVIAQNVEQRIDATGEIVEQLKRWGTHLSSNALSKWSAALLEPTPCEVPHATAGRTRRCEQTAVVVCDSCGRRACLAHCRVDYMADGTCAVCIGEARARFASARESWEDKKQRTAALRLEHAFRTLKLAPDATFAEAKRRYKMLVRKHNADVPQTEKARARNTERLKKINEAFDVLRQHFEAAA